MVALEGGSFGFQIGGQATDFFLLVTNESGALLDHLGAKEIVLSEKVRVPGAAEQLVSTLDAKAPHHKP